MPCTRSLTCPSSKHSFSSSAPIFCQRHGSREQCPQAQSDSRGKPLPEGLLQEHLTGSAVVPHRVPRGRARKEQGATNDPSSTRTCSGARARLKSAACRYGFFSAPAMGGCWFPSGGFSLNWALQAAMRHGAEGHGSLAQLFVLPRVTQVKRELSGRWCPQHFQMFDTESCLWN